MWSIVEYNHDLRNIDNYNNVACDLINTLSDCIIEATLAVSKVNIAAVQFAKFIYQYYVCTDDNDKPIQLPDHVYNKTTGELDFIFFLSITKVSYKHSRTSNITKTLNKKIEEVYAYHKENYPNKLPSVGSNRCYESQRILRNQFQDYLKENQLTYDKATMTIQSTTLMKNFLTHRDNTYKRKKEQLKAAKPNTRSRKKKTKTNDKEEEMNTIIEATTIHHNLMVIDDHQEHGNHKEVATGSNHSSSTTQHAVEDSSISNKVSDNNNHRNNNNGDKLNKSPFSQKVGNINADFRDCVMKIKMRNKIVNKEDAVADNENEENNDNEGQLDMEIDDTEVDNNPIVEAEVGDDVAVDMDQSTVAVNTSRRQNARRRDAVYQNEDLDSDDNKIDVSEYFSDSGKEDNDEEDQNEGTITLWYPPRGWGQTTHFEWRGNLHLKFTQEKHLYKQVVAIAKIDRGSFIDKAGELEVGHILTKVGEEYIHGYTYQEIMEIIRHQMTVVINNMLDEDLQYLKLTFTKDKVYRMGGTRERKAVGFYANVRDYENHSVEIVNGSGGGGKDDSNIASKPTSKELFPPSSDSEDYDAGLDVDDPFQDKYAEAIGPEGLDAFTLPKDGFIVVDHDLFDKNAFPWELIQNYLTDGTEDGVVDQSREKWAVCFNGKKLTKQDELDGTITNRWISGNLLENGFFTPGLTRRVCLIICILIHLILISYHY